MSQNRSSSQRREDAKKAGLRDLELLAQDRHPRNQTLIARFARCASNLQKATTATILKISFASNSLMLSTPIARLSSLNVQPNLLSVCLPSFLVPKPPATSGGDSRLARPGHSPSTVSKRSCPPPCRRSSLLGLAH